MSIYYGTVPLGTVLDSTLAQEIISKVIHLLDLVFLGEPIVFLPIMLRWRSAFVHHHLTVFSP